MLRLPLRSEAKNTHWESIENAGAFELFSPRVSWMRFEPSECARYTCVFDSLFSPSITGRVSVHTASLPSGEGTAAVTVFTFIESSGVHCACKTVQTSANNAVLAYIFVHPIQMSLHDVENELRLLRPVRLPRIGHHFRDHPLALERMVKLIALRGRHPDVGFPVQHERRRRDVLYERDRRVLLKIVELLPGLAAEVIRDESGNVGSPGEAPQIRDARADDGGFETMRLRHSPRRHESAVTPAHHAETIRVGDAHLNHPIDAGLIVVVIFPAPVVVVRESEGFSIAAGSAWIRPQHRISARREHRDRVQRAASYKGFFEHTRRTAVDVQNQRIFLPLLVIHRIRQQSLDFETV